MKTIKTIRRLGVLFCLLALFFVSAPVAAVDINNAEVEEIAAELINVGPAVARRIVEYRNIHGAFRTADDLQNVSGIGMKTVEMNRDKIEIKEMAKAGKPTSKGKSASTGGAPQPGGHAVH